MSSPAMALIWEIWRKNRWGFAAQLLLLAGCAALSLLVAHLTEKAKRLEIGRQILVGGTLGAGRVLPMSPTGLVAQAVQLRLESIGFRHKTPAAPEATGAAKAAGGGQFKADTSAVNQASSAETNAPRTMVARFVVFDPKAAKPESTVVYEGILSPNDAFSWSGIAGKENGIRLSLNATNLFEGPLPPNPTLAWSAAGGGKGDIALVLAPQAPEEISLAIYTAERWREAGLAWSAVLMGFSVLVVFGLFGCAEPHAARGFTGLPPRRFTLPVRTGMLVAWPLPLGGVSMLILYFAWSRLVFRSLLPAGVRMPDLYLAVLLLAGLAIFQALVCGLPSFPMTRVFLVTLLVLGLLSLAALPFLMQQDVAADAITFWTMRKSALASVCWVIGIAAAWIGVRQERRGGWAGWQWGTTAMILLRELGPTPLEFGSALRAQFWIEWKRNCRLPLLVWTLLVWMALGVTLFRTNLHDR